MGSEGRRLDPLAEAFAEAADSYDRARPGYEDEPLDWAFRELGLDAGSVVLDLAAGTGKLSRALAPRADLLIAVEPLPGMRRVLAARAPEATLLDGTAEQIPLGDGSVDAVFVGEAFHWFDGARALPEIHRVLRPTGGLALLWHNVSWHERASWSDQFEARLREVPAPHVRPENRPHTLRWQEAFAGTLCSRRSSTASSRTRSRSTPSRSCSWCCHGALSPRCWRLTESCWLATCHESCTTTPATHGWNCPSSRGCI
jgi:SAM-dependent methyltransferase